MRLPVWLLGEDHDVIYVYKNDLEELMMETYKMDGDTPIFMGVMPCNHDISKLVRIPSPRKEMFNRMRNVRIQSVGNLGQQSLF